MKKILVMFIALILCTGAAFAQISVHGWGRGAFVPYQMVSTDGDTESYTGVEASWSQFPRTRFDVAGTAEYIGFEVRLHFNDQGNLGAVSLGDFAGIWIRPWDFLRLDIGKFQGDELRGKIPDTDFHRYVLTTENEDAIFTRFETFNGALLGIIPIDGLYIGALVQANPLPTAGLTPTKAEDAYKKIQIGAGYNIGGLGHFRAQYIGADAKSTLESTTAIPSDTIAVPTIEAAFALTAVDGLVVDLGGKIPLKQTKKNYLGNEVRIQNPFQVSVGADFNADAFNLLGRVDTKFGGVNEVGGSGANTGKQESGADINLHLVPSYNFSAAKVGVEAGFQYTGETKTNGNVTADGGINIGIGAWAQKDLGQGYVKAGLAVQLPTEYNSVKEFVFTIPIIVQYSFF